MRYRRSRIEGGAHCFTVNLVNRRSDILVRHIDRLRAVMAQVKHRHPFSLIAMVVLPEHLHAIWRLPPGDGDYAMRWALIKASRWSKKSSGLPTILKCGGAPMALDACVGAPCRAGKSTAGSNGMSDTRVQKDRRTRHRCGHPG